MKKEALLPVMRRTLLALMVVFTAVLQNTVFSAGRISAFLLIPAAVSVAIFEKEFSGMFFGLLCGALWDLASPVTDGVFALVFAVCACACGLLSRYIFRNTLASALLMTVVFSGAVFAVNALFYCFARDPSGVGVYFLRRFLPSAAVTVLILPVYYYAVRSLEKKMNVSFSAF